MKRTIITFIMVLTAAAAVSCGSKTEAPEPASEVSEVSAEESSGEGNSSDYENEKKLKREKMLNESLDYIDLTAEPFPECESIPEDWQEISFGNISARCPADMTVLEKDEYSAEYADEDYNKSIEIYAAQEHEADSQGGPWFPEINTDTVKRIFGKLGLDFDGSYASYYKDVLSYTSENSDDLGEDDFQSAKIMKYVALHDFERVYHRDISDLDGYVGKLESTKYFERFGVYIFDSNTEYYVSADAETAEEALMMCSTIEVKRKREISE
ncbi:MAG: hypothetical protein IJ779_02605 [Ruminococcus sp.]|nr:hypothetical protein [Ruminococcus sp.]